MRASLLAWSLLSLFAIPTLAAPSNDQHVEPRKNHLVKRSSRSGAVDLDKPTTFNGIVVPPMKTLTPDNFEETVKDGYWSVSLVLPVTPSCFVRSPPNCHKVHQVLLSRVSSLHKDRSGMADPVRILLRECERFPLVALVLRLVDVRSFVLVFLETGRHQIVELLPRVL